MDAWQVFELGEPEKVLRRGRVPRPTPATGRVLLDVEACALNFPDVLLCRGGYQMHPELPFTPGLEVCGRDPLTGSRYAALCGPGGLSESVSVPLRSLFPVPPAMSAPTAAGLAITYQTSYVGLHDRGELKEGDTLLVHAGAGGVGSAAIQLGVAAGARVIATAGGPEKVEICRALGAEIAVDYVADDFVAVVKDATNGRGADVIYDSVGGEVFTRSTKCIAFEGRIVIIGFAGGTPAQAATNHILIKNYSVVGLHYGLYGKHDPTRASRTHAALIDLWEAGAIDPLIGETVSMDGAPAALQRLAERRTVGKVVVKAA